MDNMVRYYFIDNSAVFVNISLMASVMKTVLVFGTFDLLHAGHRFLLGEARRRGDRLVVSLARDEFVRTWKGKQPRHPEAERARRLKESGLADEVYLSDPVPRSFALLARVRPT